MKAFCVCLILAPLQLWGQSDSLRPRVKPQSSSSLKPIEFREIPYLYTTHSSTNYHGRTTRSSSTHTGIRRIYSYDGIDVDNP